LDNYNLFFQNSFENQLITDSRVSWLYTTQDPNKRQNHFSYLKVNIENSGFDFFVAQRIGEHFGLWNFPVNASGSYVPFAGLPPYSQYAKADLEYRHYWIRGKKQKFVIRGLIGGGLPYDNSTELPFTKSFFAGGSNDIRAWQFETLGPGSSPSSNVTGQIGEIKLEGNFEYRVSIIKYFGLAYFIDMGNIWLLPSKANESLPLSTFQLSGQNPWYSEVAVGTGIGARFDFTYFVFRLDFGQPVRDPSKSPNERLLTLHEYSIRRTIINIGIGYPF